MRAIGTPACTCSNTRVELPDPSRRQGPEWAQCPSTDQFVSRCGLMKQSAMVHKRPPAADDSPATRSASERLHVANIYRQIAEELGVREEQVEAAVALLDGGATVPFIARYRKEGDRRARRRAIAHAGRASALSARARGAAHRHPQFDPRAGQARRRARSRDPRRRQQGAARRHLSAVQAEAPHQGRDRQGGGAGAARRSVAGAAGERPAGRGGALRRRREAGRRCRRRARRRARDSGRTLRRGRRPDRLAARGDVVERAASHPRCATESRKPARNSATISISASS